jgi:hypothetical protein
MADSVETQRPRNPLAEWIEKNVGIPIDEQFKDGRAARSAVQESAVTLTAGPPGWPQQVPIGKLPYQDWSDNIEVDSVWVAFPRPYPDGPGDVVAACNFAAANPGYTIRARGQSHNWSPLSFPPPSVTPSDKTILVDTANLNKMSNSVVGQGAGARVLATFGTGVTLTQATQYLESLTNPMGPTPPWAPGFGFSNMPAPGHLTLGGILAIGGHGTSVPWNTTEPDLMGSMSNLVSGFTAVVSDENNPGKYKLKPFLRTDSQAPAFMVHLGRAFITEVTLVAEPNYWVDTISLFPNMNDVMANPPNPQNPNDAFSKLIETYGRVEVIWFPWIPVLPPYKPGGNAWAQCFQRRSTAGSHPPKPNQDPYWWMNKFDPDTSREIRNALKADPILTLGLLEAGAMAPEDLMPPVVSGTSGQREIYVGDNTLRLTAFGYTVQLPRAELQGALNKLYNFFCNLIANAAKAKPAQYPICGPLEIRATTIDKQDDPGIANGPPAALAASHAVNAATLDTVLWISNLTFPDTAGSSTFWNNLEQWMITQWDPSNTWVIRPEWSKGFAYNPDNDPNPGPWMNPSLLQRTRSMYGTSADQYGFNWAKGVLANHDKNRIFTNSWLDQLFPPTGD